MASRVYKAGTIITRTKDLLEAGVLKDKPIWFDVIEALPPISITRYNNPPKPGKPPIATSCTTSDIPSYLRQAVSLFDTHSNAPSINRIETIKKEIIVDKENSSSVKVKKAAEVTAKSNKEVRRKQNATDTLLEFLNQVETQDNKK